MKEEEGEGRREAWVEWSERGRKQANRQGWKEGTERERERERGIKSKMKYI